MEQTIFDVKKMQSSAPIATKSATPILDGKEIIDYRDVVVAGYASTFEATTKSDRYGDYIVQGAFADTLKDYQKNSIVLANHDNSTDSAVGKNIVAYEDARGLYVEDLISNAPGLRDLRIKIVEGIIKTFSIGGFFFYLEDGRGIYRISLFEHSLVAIPANPDALFTVRSLEVSDLDRLLTFATSRNQLENIAESIKAGRVIERKQKDLALNYLATKRGITNAQEISRPGLSVGGLQII
jgi:HK97 family phage prohead protease